MFTMKTSARPQHRPPSDRDTAIVQLVGDFKILRASDIRAVLFQGVNDPKACSSALLRLTERGYLDRLPRLSPGGAGGGGQQYVYQLGRRGWELCGRTGNYWKHRDGDTWGVRHTLAIAAAYVSLLEAHNAGQLPEPRFGTEPGCHRLVDGIDLRPDAYVELKQPGGEFTKLWLEIDRSTERAEKLADKCSRYWAAYKRWDTARHGDVFPLVLFVVPDMRRAQYVREVFQGGPEGSAELFDVCMAATLVETVQGLAQ